MNKKILIIILIGILVAGGFISFLVWKHYSKPNLPLKHYCQTDSDCVLSGSDPEGFGICVNKEWYEEWEKNPESKNCKWDCIYTGKEKCGCINNRCQRIDSERECGVKETQVIITTDKTEYKQGDIVIITIQNKGRKTVEVCGLLRCAGLATLHTNVEEYKEGEWRVITGYCPTVGFKRKKNSIVKDDLLCYSLAPKDLLTFSIPSFLSDYKIDESKRVRVVYYVDNKENPIYSNEFIIKKPTSKKCIPEGGTLFPNDGNKCCVGLFPRWNYEMQEDGSCKSISGSSGHQLICVKCGNGVCGEGENGCNCPKDCKDFKCKEHGEIPIFFLGDDMSIQCCKGLKHRLQKEYFDENCTNLFEKYGGGGYAGICLACGDGICDEKFESKCNCPEDCK